MALRGGCFARGSTPQPRAQSIQPIQPPINWAKCRGRCLGGVHSRKMIIDRGTTLSDTGASCCWISLRERNASPRWRRGRRCAPGGGGGGAKYSGRRCVAGVRGAASTPGERSSRALGNCGRPVHGAPSRTYTVCRRCCIDVAIRKRKPGQRRHRQRSRPIIPPRRRPRHPDALPLPRRLPRRLRCQQLHFSRRYRWRPHWPSRRQPS